MKTDADVLHTVLSNAVQKTLKQMGVQALLATSLFASNEKLKSETKRAA